MPEAAVGKGLIDFVVTKFRPSNPPPKTPIEAPPEYRKFKESWHNTEDGGVRCDEVLFLSSEMQTKFNALYFLSVKVVCIPSQQFPFRSVTTASQMWLIICENVFWAPGEGLEVWCAKSRREQGNSISKASSWKRMQRHFLSFFFLLPARKLNFHGNFSPSSPISTTPSSRSSSYKSTSRMELKFTINILNESCNRFTRKKTREF